MVILYCVDWWASTFYSGMHEYTIFFSFMMITQIALLTFQDQKRNQWCPSLLSLHHFLKCLLPNRHHPRQLHNYPRADSLQPHHPSLPARDHPIPPGEVILRFLWCLKYIKAMLINNILTIEFVTGFSLQKINCGMLFNMVTIVIIQ